MRWVVDSLVALMIAGIVTGVVLHVRQQEQFELSREIVRGDIQRFRQQINLQTAMAKVELTEQGYPVTVDPEWFKKDEGGLPMNPLLDDQHPWLELAGPSQALLVHPPNRVASNRRFAKFWYNPYTGAVRARVPVGVSDLETLELYNYINNCDLENLFASGSVLDKQKE